MYNAECLITPLTLSLWILTIACNIAFRPHVMMVSIRNPVLAWVGADINVYLQERGSSAVESSTCMGWC